MIKDFASYYKPHKKLFAIDLFCAFCVAVCNMFYPFIAKNIINDYVPNKNLQLIIIWCAVLLAIYLIKMAFNYVILYWGHILGVRIQAHMRKDLFTHMQKLPVTFFDDNKTGILMSRLVNDLQDISELAHHGPEDIFISVLTIIGSFIMLSFINVFLALIVVAVVPLVVFFAVLNRKKMRNAFADMRKEMGNINARIETSLSGIRVVKAYSSETHENKKFDKANAEYQKARNYAYKRMGIFHSGMEFLTDFLYLTVLVAGGLFFYFDKIDAGGFAAFILYIVTLIAPIKSLVGIFEQIQSGMTGFARFKAIMDESSEKDIDGAKELTAINNDIVFKDVNFSYKSKNPDGQDTQEVLQNINLTIEKGKTTALIGSSGCGKSTICHILMRFYDINSGQITIGNDNINDFTRASFRYNIGLVSQDVFIFDGTIKENISYGKLDATEQEIIESAKRANIHDYIMTLDNGYNTEVGERGVKLSGGQRQRISIARAFLKNPDVLILDEATSALDNVTEAQIQKALEDLSSGRTTVVVAHRLTTIQKADKIIALDSGKIVEEGNHKDLVDKKGFYYDMISANSEV